MSPQSMMEAHDVYGLMPARGLKPRKVVWRAEAARIALGPNRAPVISDAEFLERERKEVSEHTYQVYN